MNSKLREALEDAEKTLSDSSRSLYGIPPHLHELLTRIRAALAEPLRNCDVGTAEEQEARFVAFCDGCNASICDHRMFADEVKAGCAISWAQMPYEKEGKR